MLFQGASLQVLDVIQKKEFVDIIIDFLNIFTETVVAGNDLVIEHAINIKNSPPIKQVPRRVPLQILGKIDKILEEMKQQGVIEESCSPWISLTVLVKKKTTQLDFEWTLENSMSSLKKIPICYQELMIF